MQQDKDNLVALDSLICLNGKQSILICTNENCKQTAFMCDNEQCICAKEKHTLCNLQRSQYIANGIKKHKIQAMQLNKKAFDLVINIYEEMIQRISKQKNDFIDLVSMFGLGEHMQKFMRLLREGKVQDIVGDLVHKVYIEMKQQGKICVDQQSISNVWKEKIKQFDDILLKFKEFRCVNKTLVDSKIIGYDGFTKIRSFIRKPLKCLKILYRASQNNFQDNNFRIKCYGEQDTLTLVETEFGKVIGGFAPFKWQSFQSNQQDVLKKSFLFSVSLNQKYKFIDKTKSFAYFGYSCYNYGPKFGTGCDLCISNKCNSNESQANFPTSYNNGKYQNNQASYTAFSGQTNGYKFKVREYEVFKVIWQ